MRYISKLKRLLFEFINHFLVFVFKRFKLRNRVFFYSIRSDGFLTDNAKEIYDALDCKKVFFAKRLPHSFMLKPKIYYYLLTSKVIVTDDYLRYVRYTTMRKNQKLIQVWHACGAFKKFALDSLTSLSEKEERLTHSQYTDVCVSSEYVRKFYASAFGIGIDKIKALGVSRTDKLFSFDEVEKLKENIYNSRPDFKEKKIYLYAPTFREKNKKVIDFDPQVDFDFLEKNLKDNELFLINRHVAMKNDFLKGKTYSKILDVSSLDTTSLLCVSDVVITDYSSIIYETCLLSKPILFYCPDYNEYERDFYLDYPDSLPGDLITSSSELLMSIRKTHEKGISEKAEKFKEQQLSACDGKSNERICNLILNYVKEETRK